MIGPVVLLYFLGSLNAPIPRRFAAQFGDGALASFTYAMRAWSPILLLGALSISYPYFSSFAIALKEDTEHAKRLLLSMLRACFLFALPAMIAVTLLRFEIVRVLFFRGAFNAQAAMRVSSTIEFLSPFLLGSLLADLLARCLIALRRPLLACGIYGAMLALIWTVGELSQKFGFHAIALGWSLCFYAGAIGFALAVNRFLPNTISKVIPHLLRVIAAVSISGLCMAFVLHCIGSGLQESLMAALLRIAATLLTGGVVLVAAAWYLHVAEVQVLVQYGLAWSRKRLPS
jgi:putative peptidoglycan lipid II flippase